MSTTPSVRGRASGDRRVTAPDDRGSVVQTFTLLRTRVVSVVVRVGRDEPTPPAEQPSGDLVGLRRLLGDGSIRIVRRVRGLPFPSDDAIDSVCFWADASLLPPVVVAALAQLPALELRDDAIARGAAAVIGSVTQLPPEPGSAEAAEIEAILLAQLNAIVLAAHARRLDGAETSRRLYGELRALLAADPSRGSLDLAALAEHLGSGRHPLARALAAQGTSLRSLVREVRLEAIAAALRDAGDSRALEEIARSAGYSGFTQAARSFTERFGVTMGRFRTLSRL